jgi:serine/threonine protein kinase
MIQHNGATQIIGKRYQVIKQIGHGGMGAVHQAKDLLTGQMVALKRVDAQPQSLQFASRSDSIDLRLSLAQEFKILSSLRHP